MIISVQEDQERFLDTSILPFLYNLARAYRNSPYNPRPLGGPLIQFVPIAMHGYASDSVLREETDTIDVYLKIENVSKKSSEFATEAKESEKQFNIQKQKIVDLSNEIEFPFEKLTPEQLKRLRKSIQT